MIQPNELRIGNYFYENYGGYKIVCGINHHKNDLPITVDAKGIGYNVVGRFDLESIYPIPLTPEILEKCGFVINADKTRYEFDDFCIEYCDKRGMCWYEKTYVNLKYLHQFQNLYFALYGEELTFKL